MHDYSFSNIDRLIVQQREEMLALPQGTNIAKLPMSRNAFKRELF